MSKKARAGPGSDSLCPSSQISEVLLSRSRVTVDEAKSVQPLVKQVRENQLATLNEMFHALECKRLSCNRFLVVTVTYNDFQCYTGYKG